MLFNSFEFIIFFIATCVGFFALPFRWRWVLLLGANLFFYGWWDIRAGCQGRLLGLMVLVALVNHYAGGRIAATNDTGIRRFWLGLGLVVSLGVLGLFKYCDFFMGSFLSACRSLGWEVEPWKLNLILPLGISFHTFQALSYSIDIYRRQLQPTRNVAHFLVFVTFFPQLAAGPIERASHLLGQFEREQHLRLERLASGARIILWGLFKKVVIADRLAEFVNQIYASPDRYSGSTLLLATYFFAFQIYCDFSGYSDIACGTARILDFDLMQNFRLPYLAASVGEFWQRWHISLSTWFRDYVYIPLGGNRVSRARWCANIMIVFLVSGLWHGANWTFIVWGGLHGFCYGLERFLARPFSALVAFLRLPGAASRAIAILLTFHLVTLAWVFFRAGSVQEAWSIVSRILTQFGGAPYMGSPRIPTLIGLGLIALLIGVQVLQERGWLSLYFSASRAPTWLRWAGYLGLALGLALLGKSSSASIYFQF